MKTYVNTANKGTLNMRAEPSQSSKVLAQIPYGTQLEAESISSEWSKVTYNDITGYVMNKFLGDKVKQITREDLKKVYDSLSDALKLIDSILK